MPQAGFQPNNGLPLNNYRRIPIRKPTTGPGNLPPRRPQSDGPRVNQDIRADRIRLIGADGEQIGIVTTREGIRMADEVGLDLVEISPQADPPVCKILDYGKYKYEQQKKAAEARKKQKVIEIKEIKVRPGIEKHDYEVKLKASRRFLEDGDKVKVTLRFRGREMAHQELGMAVLKRLKEDLKDIGKTEMEPRMEGRQMMMVIVPLATN